MYAGQLRRDAAGAERRVGRGCLGRWLRVRWVSVRLCMRLHIEQYIEDDVEVEIYARPILDGVRKRKC